MLLLKDLPEKFKNDPIILNQLEREFGDYKDLENEYDDWTLTEEWERKETEKAIKKLKMEKKNESKNS